MFTFKYLPTSCTEVSSRVVKINYTNFLFNTEAASAIEAICRRRLSIFPFIWGLAPDL